MVDAVERLVEDSDPLQGHLEARRELDQSRAGFAIPGQVHVTDADGVVHNFVGPQTVPLTYARDGGPYLDEVEDRRVQVRRDFVLSAPNTVQVSDIHPSLQKSPSVVSEPSGDTSKLRNDGTGRSVDSLGPVESVETPTNEAKKDPTDVDVDPELLREPTDEELFGRSDSDENGDDVDDRGVN